jgi:hypothetical protein
MNALFRSRGMRYAAAAVALSAGLLAPAAPALASGNLMVTPTRVVLADSQRGTVLSLVNTGTEATTYRISLVFRRMTAAGELETIPQPGPAEDLAAHMVRYSPREVTLAPGVTQNVRVQIRRPADLPAGEYRVHMLFLEVPPAENGNNTIGALNGQKPKDVAVKLTQIYGVSIPLIMRHGTTKADISFSDLAIQPPAKAGEPSVLAVKLHRGGNRSVYGECTATLLGKDGSETEVAHLSNVAIYTPLEGRTIRMAVKPPAGPLSGRIRLSFKETSPAADKLLAEAELPLP